MLTTENTEDTEFLNREITQAVIASAISVHRELGPGLLELVYETCLAYELTERGHGIELQKEIPLIYRNIKFQSGFRADLIVEGRVLIELKSIDQLLPVHHAQVITYLKLTGIRTGLLINFNVPLLKEGLKRISL
ncbi:MAG TPA: GxxExxY protein [Terrimicrobiaceae bacterium]|nr:GxxExxY protein [Terrimicrobiaceae bacterium]